MWKVTDLRKTFDITDPDTQETATVTIQRLSEGHRMQIQALLMPNMMLSAYMVACKQERLTLSVVEWSLDLDVSEILSLDPRVIAQIDEEIQQFNPGLFPAALSDEDRAERAKNLADVVRTYLADENDGAVTKEDLAEAISSYDGEDVQRPTEAP